MELKINKHYKEILFDKGFYNFYLGRLISYIGDWFYFIGITYYVYTLTKSKLSLSFTIIFILFPRAVVSLFAGYFSDKFDAKKIMVISDVFLAIVTLIILFVENQQHVYLIYIVCVFLAIGAAFFRNAQSVFFKQNINDEALIYVNSMHDITLFIATIMSALFCGFIQKYLGFKFIIIFNSLSFALSAFFLLRLKTINNINSSKASIDKIKFISVIQYLEQTNVLKKIIFIYCFIYFGGAIANLLPSILSVDFYNTKEIGNSFLWLMIGIASICGAYFATVSKKFIEENLIFINIFIFISALAFISILSYKNFIMDCVLIMIYWMLISTVQVILQTIILKSVDKIIVGRINSLFLFVSQVMLTMSFATFYYLNKFFDIKRLIIFYGIILFIPCIYLMGMNFKNIYKTISLKQKI